MALGFYFTPASFTPEKYDETQSAGSKRPVPEPRPAGSTTSLSRPTA